jgi:hypothetical protein
MDDNRLDEILYEIGKTDIFPSQELIEKTKTRIKSGGNLHLLVAGSIVINFVVSILPIYVLIFTGFSLEIKAGILGLTTLTTNLAILLILQYRKHVQKIFSYIE